MAHRVFRSPRSRRRLALPAAAAVVALATVACAPTNTDEGATDGGAEAVVSEETLDELRAEVEEAMAPPQFEARASRSRWRAWPARRSSPCR